MNFLGIDTSAEYLTVVSQKGEKRVVRFIKDCARAHSVRLMDEVDSALSELNMKPSDCDFFAVVTGPGSFTGIRIGIACVKGLCLSTGRRALSVTSFDVLAYAESEEKLLCTVDAGHGCFYSAGYEGRNITIPPAYVTARQAEEYAEAGYRRIDWRSVDPARGFLQAILANADKTVKAGELAALYLKKSSAEENLKQ